MKFLRIFSAPGKCSIPVALAAVTLFASASYGSTLAPGACVGVGCIPTTITDFSGTGLGGLIHADTGVQNMTGVTALGATKFTGTYEEIVITDNVTGNLDFLYQFQDLTGDEIETMSVADFTNVATNVGFCSGPSGCNPLPGYNGLGVSPVVSDAANTPSKISRGSAGDVITFSGMSLPNGQTSVVLVVETDATTFDQGTIGFIDSGTANVLGYQPAPEPAFVGLLLAGLFATGLFVARKFRVQQS